MDNYRREAKQKYNEALSAYVTRYFGRPLEKLNVSGSEFIAKNVRGELRQM